jgi:hypothetical protein
MIAKFLRYPCGTARMAEFPDGGGDGLPDLAGAGFIAALQPGREERVDLKTADAEITHCRPHHGLYSGGSNPGGPAAPRGRRRC